MIAPPIFEPRLWLTALTEIGGGYALMADRRLAFLVNECDDEALTPLMGQLLGRPDRQEAVISAIERRQMGAL